MDKLALVLGANGGVGGEVARALVADGWTVRALARKAGPALPGVDWLVGDAMRQRDVMQAAQGARVIVHAVNPPGYKDWDKLVLPMLENSIAAAAFHGARLVLPGTLYNYGDDVDGPIGEAAPQRPNSRKGAIRVRMEARLRASGVRALVLRAGDFFGPRLGNSWFAQGMVTPGTALKRVSYPGAPGVGHAWAYLPDLADTLVRLLGQESRLGVFETFHFRGHWDADGRAMTGALRDLAGPVPVRRMPWWLLRLAAPFVRLLRELVEVRYLWERPYELDNTRLQAFVGETHTPLAQALRTSLEGLGCLPRPYASA